LGSSDTSSYSAPDSSSSSQSTDSDDTQTTDDSDTTTSDSSSDTSVTSDTNYGTCDNRGTYGSYETNLNSETDTSTYSEPTDTSNEDSSDSGSNNDVSQEDTSTDTTEVSKGAGSIEHHVYAGQSIQETINQANPGDVIIIHEGTYKEFIVVNVAVKLQYAQGENVILADPEYHVGPGQPFATINDAIAAVPGTGGLNEIIVVHSNAAPYIQNVVVDKQVVLRTAGDGPVTLTAAAGDVVSITAGGSGSIVQGFIINGTGADGINLNDADNCVISQNTISGCATGINVEIITIGDINTTITRNTINNCDYGIVIDDITGTTSNINVTGNNLSNNGGVYQAGITIGSIAGTSNININGNNLSNNAGFYLAGITTGDIAIASNINIARNNLTNNVEGLYLYGITIGNIAAGNSIINIHENNVSYNIFGITIGTFSGAESVIKINFNRLVGNNVNIIYGGTTLANATNNWYGVNSGPAPGSMIGNLNFDPWIVLSINASSTSPRTFGRAYTITADLTRNSAGQDTLAIYGMHVPDGIPVTFGTNLGRISPITSTTTNGIAETTLQFKGRSGAATVTAQVDDQMVETMVGLVAENGISNIILKVIATNPTQNEIQVPIDTNITITFNETVQEGAEYKNIALKDEYGRIILIEITIVGNEIIIKPLEKLTNNMNYTLTMPKNAVTDIKGHGLTQEYILTFKTGQK